MNRTLKRRLLGALLITVGLTQSVSLHAQIRAAVYIDGPGSTTNPYTVSLLQGIAVPAGTTQTVNYTGGDGVSTYNYSISSTGVTGLTLSGSGTFAKGNGTITLTLVGTPASGGNATFIIPTTVAGGVTGSNTITIPVSPQIILAQNMMLFIPSVYDLSYFSSTAPLWTAPTVAATTGSALPPGTPTGTDTPLNWQGTIPATGINVQIPVMSGTGTLVAYSSPYVTVPASMTSDMGPDNNAGTHSYDLVIRWKRQSVSTTTPVNATIYAYPHGGPYTVPVTLNAIKLDMNLGLGNNYQGIPLPTTPLQYPYNNITQVMTNYNVNDIPGIPDRLQNTTTNSVFGGSTASVMEHEFFYEPVLDEDGKVWLNNNLGAQYANVNMPNAFNPGQGATTYDDYNAYGSLYQWGRGSDGHELMTWTSATNVAGNPAPKYSTTTATLSSTSNPGNNMFITSSSGNYDWRSATDNTLWQYGGADTNDPCPVGWHVPNQTEQATLLSNIPTVSGTMPNITSTPTAPKTWAYTTVANSPSNLRFSFPGNRGYIGTFLSAASFGYYWSTTPASASAYNLYVSSGYAFTYYYNIRAYGFPVRCLKD